METNDIAGAGPEADSQGVRHFGSQSILDKNGLQRLDSWFQAVYPVTTTAVVRDDLQKRGVDLIVKLDRGGKSLAIDLKADNYFSGNITLELISQDRANSAHDEPVVGWTGKDMPLVAYMFMQTGEIVFIDMTVLYPWLFTQLKDVVEGRTTAFELSTFFVSGTPNKRYLSYNLVAPIQVLLDEAPGCLYVRAREVLSRPAFAKLLPPGGFPKPLMLSDGDYDEVAALAQLEAWLRRLKGYDVKPQLDADDKERLLRFLAPRAQFSKKRPEVKEAGLALIASRPRRVLPTDDVTVAA